MTVQNTDFGRVADDLRRASASFALLTSSATAFGASLGAFREFERQLVSTNAVALGTVRTYQQMEQAARSFALATTVSANDAVAALQNLAQAGFTAQESLQAMTGVLLLASATLTDVGVAADLISSNIRAFGLEASDTTRVANLFTASITNSLASIDKLQFALRQVGPVANVANLSIEQTTAFLSELFNVGLRGEQAGTALRNVIVRLARPTGEAAKILREIGVATVDATGNFRGLETVLQEIAAANLGEASLAKIFENEALAGAITLLKSVTKEAGNFNSAYQEQLTAISNNQAALRLTIENLKTFDSSMKLLGNTVNDLAIEIGEFLAPYVRDLADFIRETLRAFRELDPETQKFYLQVIATVAAVAGLLAGINALMLLFGNIVPLIVGATAALVRFAVVIPITALLNFRATLLAAQVTMAAFAATMTNVFRAALLALITPLYNVSVALLALGANPVLLGIGLVVAAVSALTLGVIALRRDAAAAADEMERLADIDFAKNSGRASASEKIESASGELDIKEIEARLDTARQLIDSDLVRLLLDGDLVAGIQAVDDGQKQAAAQLAKLQESERAVNEELMDVIKFREERKQLMFDPAFAYAVPFDEEALARYDEENAFMVGQLKVLEEREKRNREGRQEAERIIKQGLENEKTALKQFLADVRDGDFTLDSIFADLEPTLRQIIDTGGPELIERVAEFLAESDQPLTQENFIAALLTDEAVEGVDPALIADVFKRRQQETVRKIVTDLSGIAEELAVENEKLRIATLEFAAGNAADLEEALAAGLEAGNASIILDIQKTVDSFVTKNGEDITNVISQAQEGVQEVIDTFLKSNGYSFDDVPGIDELFGGRGLVEAIEARVDENTTPEELAQIAAEEAAKYKAVMQAMVLQIAETLGDAISPEQLEQLQSIVAGQIKAIEGAIINGATQGAQSQEAIKLRIERENKAAEDEAKRAIREAREALKDARRLEDAFIEAANAGREARSRYTEATRGLDVSERVKIGLEFDIDEINADFDNQILDLQRRLEDVEVDFKGTPEQLADLKGQYTALIGEIEKARDAEIAAASSFTSQMERRSKAIDLFIRDLTDIGIASKDTFTQVGAGIATAFAEYQQDLVTLIDITKDATSGLIDTLVTGIGDFIFDSENAWENFKKNILNISRQIFEGFTKALIQQSISSLTGGEGSILGNALQPSPYGREGTPGIGTGGILGRLFPGLAGAFGNKGAAGAGSGGQVNPLTAPAQSLSVSSNTLRTAASTLQSAAASLQSAATSILTNGPLGMAAGSLGSVGGGVASALTGGASNNFSIYGSQIASGVSANLNGTFSTLQEGIAQTAAALRISARDLATVISYETGGTFDPLQPGPTTQYGQHRGLIQFGEPQAAQYGADFSSQFAALQSQLGPNGAIVKYLTDNGFQPGMGILDLYSTINAGAPGRYNASDANNGGAPGTVLEKVNEQFAGHYRNAEELFANFNSELGTVVNELPQITEGITGQPVQPVQPTNINPQTGIPYGAIPTDPQALAGITGALPGGAAGGGAGGGVNGQPGQNPLDMAAQQFSQMFQSFMQSLVTTVNQFGQQFSQALNAAIQGVGGTGSVSYSPISLAAGGGAAGGGLFGGGGGGGGGGIFGGLLQGLLGSLFAEGGYTGDGAKMDPAGIVHKGEYVTNAKATKMFYPLLEAINEGQFRPAVAEDLMRAMTGKSTRMSGYASGGLVDSLLGTTGGLPIAPASNSNRSTPAERESKNMRPIQLAVTYNISGAQSPEQFSRSANQHAKVLMGRIERAKKNT